MTFSSNKSSSAGLQTELCKLAWWIAYLQRSADNRQRITLPVESAPFFIPSTSFCSLFSWFTLSYSYHLITVTTFALAIYHSLDLSLQTWNSSVSQILSSAVTLIPSRILTYTELKGHWRLFVLVSLFIFFLSTCATLSWSHSAFESTLNSSIVSYRIVTSNRPIAGRYRSLDKRSSSSAVQSTDSANPPIARNVYKNKLCCGSVEITCPKHEM